MTGWFGIYISKKRQDMLWPDMTWVFIIAYDLWNFCYTYNCLPTHSWYCGIALLLAPTIAGLIWNKGGWIQNRAFTLSMWCMFCQMVPMFANDSVFAADSVNNPQVNLVVSIVALAANIAALAYKRQTDRLVIVANDADYVPAVKLAREEGIKVVLDPLWTRAAEDLREHVDYVCNKLPRPQHANYPHGIHIFDDPKEFNPCPVQEQHESSDEEE